VPTVYPGSQPRGENPGAAFLTHSRYLQAWALSAKITYCPGGGVVRHDEIADALRGRVLADAGYSRIQRRNCDPKSLKRLLFNGWGTELLLGLQGQLAPEEDEPGLLALANQWAVVQAYYAIEKVVDGLVVATGNPRPDSHEKTRTLFADQWAFRTYVPWSLRHDGSGLVGVPTGTAVEQVNTLGNVNDANCWGFIEVCLRTTRAPLLHQRLTEKRERERRKERNAWVRANEERVRAGKKARAEPKWPLPLLTAAQKAEVGTSTKPTTMLDYLYRLRIRSNYQDTTMFTMGPSSRAEALEMHHNLSRLVSWTMLLHELWIRRYAGNRVFDQLVSDWLKNEVAAKADRGLSRRRDLLVGA
jgi:hypothetical protein